MRLLEQVKAQPLNSEMDVLRIYHHIYIQANWVVAKLFWLYFYGIHMKFKNNVIKLWCFSQSHSFSLYTFVLNEFIYSAILFDNILQSSFSI